MSSPIICDLPKGIFAHTEPFGAVRRIIARAGRGGRVVRASLKWAVLCVASLLPLASAGAADLPAPLPPSVPAQVPAMVPPPPRTFDCYAGVIGEAVVSHPSFNNVPVAGAYMEDYALGERGGGVGGCNYLFTPSYLGVEVTAVYGKASGNSNLLGFGFSFTQNVPFESAIRLRYGYMLDRQFSVFVAGGASVGYMTTKDIAGLTDDSYRWGAQIGVGIEYLVTPDWGVRTEYAYTYPGMKSVTITGLPQAQINPTEHLVRFVVVRHF